MASTDKKRAREIGSRITTARLEQGRMSQRELADLLGVSERSIQAYEAGEVIPYRYLRELETSLRRPAAWFLHGEAALEGPRNEQFAEILVELKNLRQDIASLKAACASA